MPSVVTSLAVTVDERIRALEAGLDQLQARLAAAESRLPHNHFAICLVSGDFEKVTAALMLANMAASQEMTVTIFFAFWGVQAVRRTRRYGKPAMEKVLAAMVGADISGLASQKFNMGGVGPAVFTQLMKQKGIATPGELLATASELGVQMQACTTSMDVFGLTSDELIPGVTCCGASQFVEVASRSAAAIVL